MILETNLLSTTANPSFRSEPSTYGNSANMASRNSFVNVSTKDDSSLVVYSYNEAYEYLVRVSQTTTDRVQIGLLLVNFVVGISANSGVLAVILSNKKLRSVPNMLMVSMIVSDILLLLNMPVKMVVLSSYGWVFPASFCRPYHWSMAFCKTCSIWIFALLARDRWKVIVYPMQFYQQYSAKSAVVGISVVYSLSAFLSLLEAHHAVLEFRTINITELNNFEFTYSICLPDRTRVGAVVTIIWQFFIPFIIISCFYIHISVTLFQLNKKTIIKNGQTINMGILQQVEKRKRLGLTVLILVVIFVVCNLPLMSCSISFAFNETGIFSVPLPLLYVANNLSYYNSTINPMVLLLMSSSLRKCIAKHRDQMYLKIRKKLGLGPKRSTGRNPTNASVRSGGRVAGLSRRVATSRAIGMQNVNEFGNQQGVVSSRTCSSKLNTRGGKREVNKERMKMRNSVKYTSGSNKLSVDAEEEINRSCEKKLAPLAESSI